MENSSFGDNTDFFTLTDLIPVNTNGATSDTFKLRISGKWHFLKRPKQKFANHPLYRAAFEKEFDIGYTLEHPNIVRYISKGNDNVGFYLLTEFIDGHTLSDFISNKPNYFKKQEHINKFVEQLLSALAYLHAKQILHLDLKPENILITNIGHDLKIVDLGFAYTDCYQFLATGQTNKYAAPEQINNGTIDQRTDIYGLGIIILYLYTQSTNINNLNKVANKYRNIVKSCLSTDINNRFSNVEAIKSKLAKDKKRYRIHLILSLVLLIGIIISLLLYPYLKKTNNTPSKPQTTDTIKQIIVVDSIAAPQEATTEIEILKQSIKKTIKAYFSPLYKKYKSAEELKLNRQDAQIMYGKAVNASFKLMDTLCNEHPTLLCEDISVWVRAELDKNANMYLSWIQPNN